MKSDKRISVVHTPMQRLWGILALGALFVCGLMVGMGIKSNKNFSASDSGLNIDQCEWAERVLLSEMPDEKTYDVYAHELRLKIYQELERFCGIKYQKNIDFEITIIDSLTEVFRENNKLQKTRAQVNAFLQNELNKIGERK